MTRRTKRQSRLMKLQRYSADGEIYFKNRKTYFCARRRFDARKKRVTRLLFDRTRTLLYRSSRKFREEKEANEDLKRENVLLSGSKDVAEHSLEEEGSKGAQKALAAREAARQKSFARSWPFGIGVGSKSVLQSSFINGKRNIFRDVSMVQSTKIRQKII